MKRCVVTGSPIVTKAPPPVHVIECVRVESGVDVGLLGSVVCGGASGIVSSSVTYPIDLVRRRMQLQGLHGSARKYLSYTDAIRDVWRSGGLRAFYTGIAAEFLKVSPTLTPSSLHPHSSLSSRSSQEWQSCIAFMNFARSH